MNNEMQPTETNSAIMSIAIQSRIEASRREMYPTAEEIVMDLKGEQK